MHNYTSEDGNEVALDVNTTLPRCAAGGREFRALFQDFRYNVRARDMLVNMLSWFHATTAPIMSVGIAL